MTATTESMLLVESAIQALGAADHGDESRSPRGFDSRSMVRACVDYADAHGHRQPTVGELCGVAIASESRLRRAFLDVVGLPPTQFFQVRVLSQLRDLLLAADPATSTVTALASSLGLTQFGRVAVRYRRLFGESPSATLRRDPHTASVRGAA